MNKEQKRVAIIGAGACGIRTAKAAKDAGFVPTIFEKSAFIGGVWSPKGLAWETMHINLSTYTMSFTDFPWPKSELLFANSRRVYQYLLDYIEAFDLGDHFLLSTQIQSVIQLEDKRWKIAFLKDGSTSSEVFDFCVVATGMNAQPIMPSLQSKSAGEFKGLIMHSAGYRSNDERLKSKKVIIIGCSASATELASDLIGHAESVSMVFRRSYLITPKIIKKQLEDGSVRISGVEPYFTTRLSYYGSLLDKNAETESKIAVNCRKKQAIQALSPLQTSKEFSTSPIYVNMDDYVEKLPHFSISEDFIDLIQQRKIQAYKGEIASFRSEGVVLNDDSFIEADVVLFCTSYRVNLSFFDEETLKKLNFDERCHNNPIVLYKNTWCPGLPNMGFVGFYRSVSWIASGLQAEWMMTVFNNQRQLPPQDIISASVNEELADRSKDPYSQFPYSVAYLCDMIAKEIEKAPDLDAIKREDPELYGWLWNGPLLAEHFQLNETDSEKIVRAVDRIRCINNSLARKFTIEEAAKMTIFDFYLE